MNHFLLLPLPALKKVTEEQLAQLRAVDGVQLVRVSPYIVSVHFDGDEAQLKASLEGTVWVSFHMSRSRTYRLQ
ncbi:hypothetical protein AB4Y45_32745 [Paraburkholderia sp. EG287A]|uniref:hypothetical protein n=1 Tax=Paraburkholderia sp. EG287A TaxID=3237012 RepID=UPI0034D295A6